MEEVLEAVKGLASWDAWAKLITASRASPLARSHALASFNYDEVVVMDGFLEFLSKEKDENKKCAVLGFLQENIVYFLSDHRRMEKVCSGLNQLITAADSSPSFRSMVLVTLTHIFLELDMLHAHPPAFEAFVEILLEQASPPQPPTPSRSSSASLAPTAEHTLPPGARLLRLHATECLREIELAYPTIFAAQLPHFLAFARRDLTHASYSFSLLAAQVLHHAVFAQHSHEAAQTSPLFAEHEVDLLPISFPIDFAPPAPHQASSLVPRSALPPQHEITEALIKRAWVAVAGEAMNGQTKWGSCELLLLLYSIRSALGVDRDLDKTISPFVSTFARTASPLHVHLLLKLFRASVAAGQSPLATSDDINALSTTIASAISCVEALTPRLLLAHLIPAANSFSSSPALPLAAWPSVFDPLPLKLARLSSFVASLPASDPTRYAPQLLSVLQCLESEAKASAHLPTPGDATRAYFGVLEQYIARFPSASTSLFSLFASWLELETGNAPPPSSLGLIGALLDRLKETQASLSLLQLLAEALLRLHEKNATALIHYVPIAQRVLEEPQIPPAPLLQAYTQCVSSFIASVPSSASFSISLPALSTPFPTAGAAAAAAASAPPPPPPSSSSSSPSLWSTGNSIIDLCRTALLTHTVSSLFLPLGTLLSLLASSYPDLEIRNRADFFYRLATHVPSRTKLHQLLQLAALDEEETAGFVASMPSSVPDASPNSSIFSTISSAPTTPLRRGGGSASSVFTSSPLTLILERHNNNNINNININDNINQTLSSSSSSSSPSTIPSVSSSPVPPADALIPPLASLTSDFLNFARQLALDDPPLLTLHLCLRVASSSDFHPLLSGPCSPLASPRASFAPPPKDPPPLAAAVLADSPAGHLNSIVVSFAPLEFYRQVLDIRVPYLSVPPSPDEECDEVTSSDCALSPRPPAPPPLHFPYAFLLDLTLQPDFPLPALLHPRASFSDGDGKSFAAIPISPLSIVFGDLFLSPRLPPSWPRERSSELFSALWKEFTGDQYGVSVKHVAVSIDAAVSLLRKNSLLSPFILPGPKLRALILLPPQYHLLLKMSPSEDGILIRIRTDCWQALVFADETLEAAFKGAAQTNNEATTTTTTPATVSI